MSGTSARNVAESVRARLFARSRERNETFQRTLTYFAIERLLYRLSRSKWKDRFVLTQCVTRRSRGGAPAVHGNRIARRG